MLLRPLRIFSLLFMIFYLVANVGYSGNELFIVPFENYSGDPNVFEKVKMLVVSELNNKSVLVYNDTFTFRVLEDVGIREKGMVYKKHLDELYSRYGIRYVLTGSILKYDVGKNPKFSLHLRLIDAFNKTVLWANYAGNTGEDNEGFFGLKKIRDIDTLVGKVVPKVLSDFSMERAGDGKRKRIAVVIFENLAESPLIGKEASYMILSSLSKLEIGVVRELMVKLWLLPNGAIDYEQISAFRDKLGVDYILIGSVEDFKEDIYSDFSYVLLSVRVIDSVKKKILFVGDRYLNSYSKEGVLEFGRLRSSDLVLYNAIKDLVGEIERRIK